MGFSRCKVLFYHLEKGLTKDRTEAHNFLNRVRRWTHSDADIDDLEVEEEFKL